MSRRWPSRPGGHDLVAIRIGDRREEDLPDIGFVDFEDADVRANG